MKFTLRQLEVFLAVAHHSNISRAAEQLAMSQSAASSALKDLESQFDIQLFDRAGKRLQINELGRVLQPRAEALLDQAGVLQNELLLHKTAGRLRIGATLTIGNYLITDLMTQYLKEHPSAQLDIQVANTATVAERVINFDLDIGLIEGEIHHPELETIPWQTDQLVIFCASDNPLANKKTLSDTDLININWILRETGSGTRQTFDRAMFGLLGQLKITLQLEQIETIKRSVQSGLGVGCLSAIALENELKQQQIKLLDAPGRNLNRQLYLIVNRKKYRSAGMEYWIELCMRAPHL